MTVEFSRRTLTKDVTFSGLGLHSGVPVDVAVRPGKRGIWLRCGEESLQATPENVSETTRCTKLGGISTIEHLMSALAGLGITDAEVELTTPECPALDGSSVEYLKAFSEAGTVEIGRSTVEGLFTRVYLQETNYKIGIAKGDGHWRYTFTTGDRWPGTQVYETTNVVADYAAEIAPARTIGFEEELPLIQQMGLAKGLDMSKAIILGKEGYITEPRFADEPARHKMLDAIGDLFLAGLPPGLLSVTCERSGHKAHVEAAWKLAQFVKIETNYF